MATEVVKVIDPDMGSGYDYDSLFDWEAAQQGDLTGARDEIAVAKCRCTAGTADTTTVSIVGWTTSATQYIKVWTDTAESYRHNGTYQTGNKYRIVLANTYVVYMYLTNYIRFDGIQIYVSAGNGSYQTPVYIEGVAATNNRVEFTNCIFRGHGGAYFSSTMMLSGTGRENLNIINCVIYGFDPTESNSRGLVLSGATQNVYNTTVIGGYIGIQQTAGTVTAKNCYAGGQGLGGSYSGTITMTTCASGDTTGTAGLQSIALNTTNFTNVTAGSEDFHLPSGSALIGAATNLYNDAAYPFQTDIDGQDRGGAAASWDIGADEYVSAAAIEQEGFRFRNDDGSESTATWKANQDVNINLAADTAFRLRFLLKATGNPDSIDAQAEARVKPSGGAFGAWEKIN